MFVLLAASRLLAAGPHAARLAAADAPPFARWTHWLLSPGWDRSECVELRTHPTASQSGKRGISRTPVLALLFPFPHLRWVAAGAGSPPCRVDPEGAKTHNPPGSPKPAEVPSANAHGRTPGAQPL